MKNNLWIKLLTVSTLALTSNAALNQAVKAQGTTYICGKNQQGEPTTIAQTDQGNVPIVTWRTQKGGGYTPQKRCEIVSAKFQDFNDRGILKYLSTGRENGLNVICVTPSQESKCETLYTLSDQTADPGEKLKELLSICLQTTSLIPETTTYIDMCGHYLLPSNDSKNITRPDSPRNVTPNLLTNPPTNNSSFDW